MRVAVLVAHPDDEVLGCGATLAKLVGAGDDVRVVLPLRRTDSRGDRCWDKLVAAFESSCDRLGVMPVVLSPLIPDTMAATCFRDLHDAVAGWVDWAELVLTHWPGDTHQDHTQVFRAVEVAARAFRRRRDVHLFEVPTSSDQSLLNGFHPNTYVLLEESHASRKCEAMGFYEDEWAIGRRPEDLLRRMQVRGAEVGADLAEAFVVGRQFR